LLLPLPLPLPLPLAAKESLAHLGYKLIACPRT